jgi:hypothetical protein
MEDSPIVHQNVGVGYGKEIYGDAVVEWYHFDLKPNVKELGDCKFTITSGKGVPVPLSHKKRAVTHPTSDETEIWLNPQSPPSQQIWGYLCLYQNLKVTPFCRERG